MHAFEVGRVILFLINQNLDLIAKVFDQFKIHNVPKINISSNQEMTTFGMAELVASIMKKNFSYEIKDSEPGRSKNAGLNNDLLTKKLGYKMDFNLETSVEKIVKWYLQNSKWI